METISFAAGVKEELALLERDDESKRSLLSSFIKINGHIRFSNGVTILELVSENAKIAGMLYRYLHTLYGVSVSFSYTRSAGLARHVHYHVNVKDEASDILDDLGVDPLDSKGSKAVIVTDTQVAAYLSGAFLASGSVNSPESSHYHLEITLGDEDYAKWLSKTWNKYGGHHFSSKVAKRRKQFIVYLKKSEEIADFIALMGASEHCLLFENIRVDRDFSNVGNRLMNLDSANMGKTLKAAERQKMEINYFVNTIGYDRIDNEKLKALMRLRLLHEDATLEELAHLLSEELSSTVSKSNVNHLFRHLDSEYKKATHGK